MEHIARWRRHARGNGYRCCDEGGGDIQSEAGPYSSYLRSATLDSVCENSLPTSVST